MLLTTKRLEKVRQEISGLHPLYRNRLYFKWFEERTTKKKFQICETRWDGLTIQSPDGRKRKLDWYTLMVNFTELPG